jgi:hypothetical protein
MPGPERLPAAQPADAGSRAAPGAERRVPRALLLAALLVAGWAACACSTSDARFGPVQRTSSPIARVAGGRPAHVAVIVMENEEYSGVIGAKATPYINALARRYALATRMFAIGHPSLPNYLALTGGSTFGITSDCTNCSVPRTSLVDQLSAAHISWRGYMEDLPSPCFSGASAGLYAKKHNPFMYYTRVAGRPDRCSHVVRLSQLGADERSGALPRFIWVTPNLCHDMHSCPPTAGDRFLAGLVPGLLRSLGSDGVLLLTWDEGSTDEGCCRLAAGGHVATIVAGPGARRGARLSTPVDHYSTLQTIEDLLGLPRLRAAACPCTPSLGPLLAGPLRPRHR